MPAIFYDILFWIYWVIAAIFGGLLAAVLFRSKDNGERAVSAMLLVPVILRLLLIK